MGKGAQGSDAAAAAAGAGEVNMAAWLVAKNTLKIMPFELPPLGPHDVRVRMKAVGICGSDVHYLREMRIAHFVVKEPMVIGHECAGVIEEVGAGVTHLSVGDRVALEPGVSCWRCRHCKGGRYNLCSDMKFFATPPVHGSLANQVVHPGDLCFKLPDGVTLEEGAMCEPLSVGVHACRRAGVGPETGILVVGAGPIGLVTLLAARAFGAPRVVIVDVDDHRLSVATALGADATVKVSTRDEDLDAEVERIQAAMGADIDVSLDCAGFSKTISLFGWLPASQQCFSLTSIQHQPPASQQYFSLTTNQHQPPAISQPNKAMSTALEATRAGGKVCLIGMGHNEMTLPMTSAAAREVDVVGVFRYKDTWPLCIGFLRSGKVDVKPLITHRFGFSQRDVEEAFEVSARGRDAIKVMFNL